MGQYTKYTAVTGGTHVRFALDALRDFRDRLPCSHPLKIITLHDLATELEGCFTTAVQTTFNPRCGVYNHTFEIRYHDSEFTFAVDRSDTVIRIRRRRKNRKGLSGLSKTAQRKIGK